MKQLLLFLLLFVSANSFAQKTKEESATEKFVLKLHENKFRWMVNKQLDSLNAILDERVQHVHSNGWTENRAEIIKDIKSGKLIMTSVKVSEATARVYKGFVIVNGKDVFNVVMNGTPIDVHYFIQKCMQNVKTGGYWCAVMQTGCLNMGGTL